jgi:hypothetical protein
MKIQLHLLLLGVLFFAFSAYCQRSIPAGTILPVRLNGTLSSKNAKPNEAISARVMQDVALPDRGKITEGTKVTGHVIEVRPAAQATDSLISFVFDRVLVSKQSLPVTTGLRALASVSAVESALIPTFGMGEGDSWNGRTTVQVGGEVVYWGGGPVVSRTGPVGKPLVGADSGVLVRVTVKPGGQCRGDAYENQRLQALWVFSSDACGVYGLDRLAIAHSGSTEPVGVVALTSKDGETRIGSGSGMLLCVIEPSK